MRNRWTFLLFVVMMVTGLWAQNSISDINRIKRDKDYLYGEATLDKKDAALKLAYELLEVEIKNWATNKNSKISSVLASKVYEYADTLILQRHNMVRAFVYVKTSNLKAIKGKSLSVEVDHDKPLTKPVAMQETEPEPVSQPEVKQEVKQEIKQEVKDEAVEPAIVEIETPLPKEEKSIEDEVLQRLMAISTFYDLEKTIKPLQSEGKITDYGKYTTMKDPLGCYLIIYDKQANIKAFLGKGLSSRPNLKTGVDDSEKNYPGCGAIWFKIKEQKK